MRLLTREIYEKLDLGSGFPSFIPASGTSVSERVAYLVLLHQGLFGNEAFKMLAEYVELYGRSVKAFRLHYLGCPDARLGLHHLFIQFS